MDPQKLHESLAKLHQELERAPKVDAESRKLLLKLMADIGRLVGKPEAAAGTHRPRLKELEAKFEADHPALAATLREFIDLLAKAGL
jgi:hypothetical protein